MSLTTQFYTMLAMIAMGSIFGASLDTYNRFLQRGKRKRWIVFINDVMFWLIQGLAVFYILFLVNYGEVRFYIFVALVCGFAAYQALMKNIYLKLLEILISAVISIYQFIVEHPRAPQQYDLYHLHQLLLIIHRILLLNIFLKRDAFASYPMDSHSVPLTPQ